MARAFLLIRLMLVLAGVLVVATHASARPGGDSGPKSAGTLGMLTATTASGTRVNTPSAGASLAPKAVVRNPYNVPLLQNAGSFHSSR
jgi:hypothetical protein